ncbi:MAG: hypothetical protein LKI24_09610 [Acidipropionibacterium sp.]|jgi:hypothetical protein|nr:hypothetical protein [Acidipropionibacterium sp.]
MKLALVSMRTGEHLPGDQAEVVLSDDVIDWIVDHVTEDQRDEILDDIVDLFAQPWGKHPLSNRRRTDRLAGLNTASTLSGDYRIVFRSSVDRGVGLIEIIAIGPRSGHRIYDAVNALIATGKLDEGLVQQIWDLLALYQDTADRFGLELWDYRPPAAPDGLVRAAAASGALPADSARLLSSDELMAAMADAWDPVTGKPDIERALAAAVRRVAGSSDPERVLARREEPRCGVLMPRARKPCIRRRGHPGAHRATP